jgi:apolipoprotein D and lipocalin family protein
MCALIPPLFSQNTGGKVDLNRYAGLWYVIACIPMRIDATWEHVTESYSFKEHKKVNIYTTYTVGNGTEVKHVRPKGFIRSSDNSFWRVQLFWPFRADYLIEEIGNDYSYAIVGHRKKKHFYILSRTSQLDAQLYKTLIDRYSFKGYNMSLLRKVKQ